ncbi:MAG: FAD-dependent oxidoreductase [Limnochordia bacterium]|nr:FAD-dependent oxidoreductase [Limnochordia bacterium]
MTPYYGQSAQSMRRLQYQTDICVLGGGLSGMCAAIAAARSGAGVVLIHDRPVLGGNASSEIRMHICGADRHGQIPNMRETGILEEIRLENAYRNPQGSYSVWDTVLWEMVFQTPNIKLLLNCSCYDASVEQDTIRSITAWQLTTETHHTVEASIYLDCTGDGILGPLAGAEFRLGREAASEFGESLAPEKADSQTMGCTCMFRARKHDTPQPFTPPKWAYKYPTDESLGIGRGHRVIDMGYWWIEVGGKGHPIYDLEEMRDELLRMVYGVWDHIKNHGDHGAEYYALDWIQFLPGKRESRRLMGDHILTQGDIEAEGRFEDLVAYGGWTMDDHTMGGFRVPHLQPTHWHPAPSPYGIPYRCLYSKNITNLGFAGRNISATHIATSSTRVMGTCAVMGQAIGTAAALATKHNCSLRDIGQDRIKELQRILMDDDCYLPWHKRQINELTLHATLTATANPEPLRDGVDRPVGENDHAWIGSVNDCITYTFGAVKHVKRARFVFDTGLDRSFTFTWLEGRQPAALPQELVTDFEIEALVDGQWQHIKAIKNNYQRLVYVDLDLAAQGIRFTPKATRGARQVKLYGFTLE